MEPIHIALIVLAVLLLVSVAVMIFGPETSDGPMFLGMIGAGICGLLLIVVGWMALGPEYRLWRATIEKRILVEEARAQADASVELARAEVERATGTAEANLIVADSITEQYLRYLYINSLAETNNQVIYLPTEAGLPILEADRFEQPRNEGG